MLKGNAIGQVVEGMIGQEICSLSTIVGLIGSRPKSCQLEVRLSNAIPTEVSVLLPRPN